MQTGVRVCRFCVSLQLCVTPSFVSVFHVAVVVRDFVPSRVALRTMDPLCSLTHFEIERRADSLQAALAADTRQEQSRGPNLRARSSFAPMTRPEARALQQQRMLYTDRRAGQSVSGSKRWRAGVLSGRLAAVPRRRRRGNVFTRMVRAPSRGLTIGASWMHLVVRRLCAISPVGVL